MDNTTLNQTETQQMPNNMGGTMPTGQQLEHHHKGGKGIFIAILIIVIAILLGYWYISAPKKVPDVENMQQQNSAATTGAEANINAAEEGLDELYFEGVSEGL